MAAPQLCISVCKWYIRSTPLPLHLVDENHLRALALPPAVPTSSDEEVAGRVEVHGGDDTAMMSRNDAERHALALRLLLLVKVLERVPKTNVVVGRGGDVLSVRERDETRDRTRLGRRLQRFDQ